MLRIVIDGYDVDYGDENDLKLALTYSIADINTLGGRSSQGSRSYDIKLPATKNNKQIFGFVEETNVSNGFDHTIEKTCYVEVDGSVVINGNARIKGVFNALGGVDKYSCVIIGDNAAWFNGIKDLSLNELDFSDQSHFLSNWKIRADYSNLDDSSVDFIYPLINYGQWGAENTLLPANIDRSKTMFPAIRIRSYLKKILLAQGYIIKSDFIDSDYFGNLIMPFTGKEWNDVLPASFRDDRLFRATITPRPSLGSYALPVSTAKQYILFDDESTEGNFDTGSLYDNTNSTYTVDANSVQEFIFNYDISTTNNKDIRVCIEREDVYGNITDIAVREIKFTWQAYEAAPAINTGFLTPDNIKSGFINVKAGDKIRCYIQVFMNRFSPNFADQDLFLDTRESLCYFYNNVQLSYGAGQTVDLNNYLPDLNQLEYVKGLRDVFNWHILTDIKKKIVYIEPRDDFFNSTAIDWTSKLDTSKGFKTSFMGSKFTKDLKLAYQSDNKDANLKLFTEEKGYEYGSDSVAITNVNSKEGESTKRTAFFAPTFMQECPQIGMPHIKLPTMISDLDEYKFTTSFLPRILHYTGNKLDRFPVCNFIDTTIANDYGLQFGDDINTSGLNQRYHRNLYNTINTSRLIDCEMYLTPTDIETFDFRNPISLIIGGEVTYYHINKISSYKPLKTRLTRVQLLKVVNPIPKASITESINILPPDVVVPVVTNYVKVSLSSITVNVKANIGGNTKEIRK